MTIQLTPTPYNDDLATSLVGELMADLAARYGTAAGDDTRAVASDFDGPDGDFFVARAGKDVVGSIGLRRHDERTVEIKRMFIRPRFRRFGYARQMLRLVETSAREHGYERVVLESGHSQPEACSLYEAEGYDRIESYGTYRAFDDCRCYGKDL